MSRIASTIGAALLAAIAFTSSRAAADSIVAPPGPRRVTPDSITSTSVPRTAPGRIVATVSVARDASDSIATANAYLPAVNITGATGVYRTDVWIFNPEPILENEVSLYFTPADVDGTNLQGISITPALAPRESVTLADIVRYYFEKTGTYGMLEIRATYPVLVTSNTYNVAGAQAGTYGQYSPGQAYRSALGFDDSVFGDLYVTGLTNDPTLRTNAIVMNPTDLPLEAGVQLVDSSNMIYGTRIVTVPPFSLHQLNDVFGSEFAAFAPPPGGTWRLNMFVNLGNGAKILGYTTVTDKRTGDPYLIPAQAMRP